MRRLKLQLLAIVAVVTASVAQPVRADDIVDTAVNAGSFKTLAAALQAADLVGALKGKGPFTVFAPTDEAFAKLPKGTVEELVKPKNKAKLTAILTYHVVAGEVPAAKVVKLSAAKTLNGQRVDVNASGGKVMIDKANVVKADIKCSNGIIHVIDSVILPSMDNIPATAAKAGSFKTLLAAAKAAGLVDALSSKGPLTVFAPTDEAFAKLPKGTVEYLLKPENKSKLAAVLKYHVVSGRVFSDDAVKAKKAKTLLGQPIHISVKDGAAKINKSNLVTADIDASNGVIHVIDAVLLPSAKKKISRTDARDMIYRVVAHGSRLYNSGHHAACAKTYMTAIKEMRDYGSDLPAPVMKNLSSTLDKASRTHSATDRAWTLRHALDHAYAAMRPIN